MSKETSLSQLNMAWKHFDYDVASQSLIDLVEMKLSKVNNDRDVSAVQYQYLDSMWYFTQTVCYDNNSHPFFLCHLCFQMDFQWLQKYPVKVKEMLVRPTEEFKMPKTPARKKCEQQKNYAQSTNNEGMILIQA